MINNKNINDNNGNNNNNKNNNNIGKFQIRFNFIALFRIDRCDFDNYQLFSIQ